MKSVTLLAAFSYVLLWPSGVIGQSKPMTIEEMHRLHQDPNAYVAMYDLVHLNRRIRDAGRSAA